MQTCLTILEEAHDASVTSFDSDAFEQKIEQTIREFNLFTRDSKVLVACSGGKDSTVILHVLKKLGYHVEAITVDAHIGCYTEENLKNLRMVCMDLGVRLHEISFRKEFGSSMCYIQTVLKAKGYDYKNCHTCGVLRRYLLNTHSRKIQPDVLVTGHNLDDEAQVVMMNLLRGQVFLAARLGPRTSSVQDGRFIPRVKPMYFCQERDVVLYSKQKRFPVHYGECPCSSDSYRRDLKGLFTAFGEDAERVKANIVKQFMRLSPALKRHHASLTAIGSCGQCGEPASGERCSACLILTKLHEERP